jgi:hypothetical protein
MNNNFFLVLSCVFSMTPCYGMKRILYLKQGIIPTIDTVNAPLIKQNYEQSLRPNHDFFVYQTDDKAIPDTLESYTGLFSTQKFNAKPIDYTLNSTFIMDEREYRIYTYIRKKQQSKCTQKNSLPSKSNFNRSDLWENK